jgi:7,8-didemethyl-8-hydroxy-5-deazariboflavin synthase CofG subunit
MVDIANTCIVSKEAFRLLNAELSWIDLLHYLDDSPFQRSSKTISFSKNISIPVTRICRNKCGYCSFVEDAGQIDKQILSPEKIEKLLQVGAKSNCKEALFMLGERPEENAPEIHDVLVDWGYHDMLDYLFHMCKMALSYGMLPHTNAGVLNEYEFGCLHQVNASMGLMLESTSEHLCRKGGPHELSPGKLPSARLRCIEEAGKQKIPFTTGIMVGIGEEPGERIDALLALRALHRRYGHIQEIIIQKFCPKRETPMATVQEPEEEEILKTIMFTRLIFGTEMNIQAPYNLNTTSPNILIRAGANDWGGISPLTEDLINPEKKWPNLDDMKKKTQEAGYVLKERLAVYPEFIKDYFLDPRLKDIAMSLVNHEGYVREDSGNGQNAQQY